MTIRGIISDLHGNLEACQAVLDDARQQGAEEIVCLGDVVNYGPDPVACVRLSDEFTLTLMGNNEHALMEGARRFRPAARQALAWTRERLVEAFGEEGLLRRLQRMPILHRDGPFLFVHASPRDPLSEYLSYRDARTEAGRNKLGTIFQGHFEGVRVCFCGHTHSPGLVVDAADGPAGFGGPALPSGYSISAERLIVIVGSVGQPRNATRGASYVIVDTEAGVILFRRVAYPVERTAAKALRELFLWQYACKLMGRQPSPEAARALTMELRDTGHLNHDEAAEITYFLRLSDAEEEGESA